MKKCLPLFILFFVLTVVLIPTNLLNAQPTELVTNGDFEMGLNNWSYSSTGSGSATSNNEGMGANYFATIETLWGDSYCRQTITIPSPDLKFSYKVRNNQSTMYKHYYVKVALYNGSSELGFLLDESTETITEWMEVNHDILSEFQAKYPSIDFSFADSIRIYFGVINNEAHPASSDFDDFSLTYEEKSTPTVRPESKPAWTRTMPMTCWQVWINEDNMFEFIFWYPCKDNNWVRIYDMEGNMIYEVDVPLNNPRIVVDLPDGMYNVKTFRFDPENPIQEFLIGKP